MSFDPAHISDKFDKKIRQARAASEKTIDGYMRTDELEERINIACRTALTGPDGDLVMDYIKSITTQVVVPPSASDAELRMLEGMRRLCGILDTRRRTDPKG